MNSLSVLSVAYPFALVRPDTAGGAEQVLCTLDKELTEAGHRSVVIAAKGSDISGHLIETPLLPCRTTSKDKARVWGHVRDILRGVFSGYGAGEFDIVHMHGVDFMNYLPPEAPSLPPVLITLHMWPSVYGTGMYIAGARSNTYFNAVSATQAKACNPVPGTVLKPGSMPVIENGAFLSASVKGHLEQKEEGYALCLGRICEEKGFHIALEAAKMAGVPLVIAGEVFQYPEHESYFRRKILPGLDGIRYKFVGRVGWVQKTALIRQALCLLLPSLVEETSSLSAIEALSCGTPVIAFAKGALPEIIEQGVTGFMVDGAGGMAHAILKARTINRQACAAAALKRASASEMARQYTGLYHEIIEHKKINDLR